METGLSRNHIIAELSRSSHGKLEDYLPVGRQAALREPEFFSHLIAWDRIKGQVRDSKVALPVISLLGPTTDEELKDNALAHLALLTPRQLLQAVRFSKTARTDGRSGKHDLERLALRYLRALEGDRRRWEHAIVQHRRSLVGLYTFLHLPTSARSRRDLLRRTRGGAKLPYRTGSAPEVITRLSQLPSADAAEAILRYKIPSLVVMPQLGPRLKEPEIGLALIERMSATELVTHTELLKKLGVKTHPVLRGAYEAALQRATVSKKATLKTTRAAEDIHDEQLQTKLRALQEKQLNTLGGVAGNWLVLGDKSGSMSQAIAAATEIAAILARMAKGQVHLVFFDTQPRYISATGKTLEQLKSEAKRISADGGTSVGCGLLYAIERGFELDGIAIVSDGHENASPLFAHQYASLKQAAGKQVPVYLYLLGLGCNATSLQQSMAEAKQDLQVFDLRGKAVDYYALPNLANTMRSNRYSLADEIMATPLLKLDDVLKVEQMAARV